MKPEITELKDVQIMVDSFYEKIREDELLGPIFDGIIKDNWPNHLRKMYRFWQTILLNDHTYYGSPFPPHAKMPLEKRHFERWVEIFNQNMNELYEGEKAEEASWRAKKMADMFLMKINYYQNKDKSELMV